MPFGVSLAIRFIMVATTTGRDLSCAIGPVDFIGASGAASGWKR